MEDLKKLALEIIALLLVINLGTLLLFLRKKNNGKDKIICAMGKKIDAIHIWIEPGMSFKNFREALEKRDEHVLDSMVSTERNVKEIARQGADTVQAIYNMRSRER